MNEMMAQRTFRSSLLRLAIAAAPLLPLALHAQTITSYAPLTIPQTNPGTNTQPPPYKIDFIGTGFLTTTTAKFTWTGGNGTGAVHYVSATSVVVTLPTTIPSTVTSVTPSLCNGTSCATGAAIAITALDTSIGSLTGTPNPTPIQPVVLSSTFKPYQPPNSLIEMGAPSGTVTFTSGTTTLGTSKLVLDPTNSSFTQDTTTTLSQGPQGTIYTADFNGDGIPDVVFYDDDNQLHVLLGTTPYGSFQPELLYPVPEACEFMNGIATGDINNDGFADIVLACSDDGGNNYVYSMLSNGDGTFATPVAVSNAYGYAVALGDMNNDGKLDLVVVGLLTPPSCEENNNCVSGFAIFDGNGTGAFTFSNQVPSNTDGYTDPLLIDVDHDGYLDIVALSSSSEETNSIDIYLSHAGTSYGVVSGTTSSPSYSIPLQPYPYIYTSLFTADFNGDGLPDLGVGYTSAGALITSGVNTTLNTSTLGNASFGALNLVPTGVSNSLNSVMAADLNGDGFPDLIVNSGSSGQFFEGDGKGNFANTYTNLTLPTGTVSSIAAVDLNDDGDADLLVVPQNDNEIPSLVSYITTGTADANLTFTPTQAGPNLITAAWPGNVDFLGASPTFTLTVNGDSTSTSISRSLAATQYGQSETLTSTVTSVDAGTPTGTITFLDGTTTLAVVNLVNATASYTTSTLKVGKHTISAVYSGDTTFAGSTSGNATVSVNAAQPVISWTPSPATITYGTALGAGQLDATAASTYVTSIPGTFNYTPASGAVLGAGPQTLNVSFTPTDTVDFATATGTASITVGKATPTVTWNPPAAIVVGTPLSTTQLDATAAGPLGPIEGTFAYTPVSGTVLAAGADQALSVLFTPSNTTDYTTATGGTTITVIALAITSLSPSSAVLGSPATKVTLTGTGFLPNSVININGAAVSTTYISATSLSTTIPAATLLVPQTLSLTVTDPTQQKTSSPATFSVLAAPPTATFTGPSTTAPGDQPNLDFTLTSNYPIPITGTLTLTFAGTSGADDPAIQFSGGGRTLTFTIPANSTATPTIALQSGTDAGTITVTLVLTAGGQVITPASIVPLLITIPTAVPSITSMSLTRTGNTITANIIGYSDTRELVQATFHFTGASGDTINTPDITVPATTLFGTWYSNDTSQQYGSTFLYTQVFNLSGSQSTIGSVTVTLTNTVGASTSLTAQ
jgi:hypothetical protein